MHRSAPKNKKYTTKTARTSFIINIVSIILASLFGLFLVSYAGFVPSVYNPLIRSVVSSKKTVVFTPPKLNKSEYDVRMLLLSQPLETSDASNTSITITKQSADATTSISLWPVDTVYPKYRAIFPFNRVVAYYGNFYSKQMGVLGEYPVDEVLKRLSKEVTAWNTADPNTPVIPAIDYIAVTAQDRPGKDLKYRLRMPDSQINKAIQIANEAGGVVILDVQVGLSTLQQELPYLRKFLKLPQVELAIDPEFSMKKSGAAPGTVIGTFDAVDVNYASGYLASLVREYHLPPKFLVIHRFTEDMVTNYKEIKPLPEVQIVLDMDGWGSPARKKHTYRDVIYKEPIQFTGFKLFYKNDIRPPSDHVMTPTEVLKLTPQPVFIQYQ